MVEDGFAFRKVRHRLSQLAPLVIMARPTDARISLLRSGLVFCAPTLPLLSLSSGIEPTQLSMMGGGKQLISNTSSAVVSNAQTTTKWYVCHPTTNIKR